MKNVKNNYRQQSGGRGGGGCFWEEADTLIHTMFQTSFCFLKKLYKFCSSSIWKSIKTNWIEFQTVDLQICSNFDFLENDLIVFLFSFLVLFHIIDLHNNVFTIFWNCHRQLYFAVACWVNERKFKKLLPTLHFYRVFALLYLFKTWNCSSILVL